MYIILWAYTSLYRTTKGFPDVILLQLLAVDRNSFVSMWWWSDTAAGWRLGYITVNYNVKRRLSAETKTERLPGKLPNWNRIHCLNIIATENTVENVINKISLRRHRNVVNHLLLLRQKYLWREARERQLWNVANCCLLQEFRGANHHVFTFTIAEGSSLRKMNANWNI